MLDRAVPFAPDDVFYALRQRAPIDLFGPVPTDDAELADLAREHPVENSGRRRVLDVLRSHWRRLDLDAAARESFALLDDAGTQVVVTGQQPALAGGPLMLFAKALSCARLARRLRSLGVPTVPIFWIADEDHDVAELSSGRLGPRVGAIEIPFDPGRRPLADLRLDREQRDRMFDALEREFGADDPGVEMLEARFDPGPSVWFREALLALLAGEGLLPLHPGWLRELQAPLIAEELDAPGRLVAEVARGNERLRDHGAPAPIPRASEVPFFVFDDAGERHRVERSGESYALRSAAAESFTRADLRAMLENEPERFSPDALFRPIVQDSILQPFATIVGPTEMGYQLELVEAYAERRVSRPLLVHRLRPRVLDRGQVEVLARSGVAAASVEPATDARELVVSLRAEQRVGELGELARRLAEYLRKLEDDPGTSTALSRRVSRLTRRLTADFEKLGAAIRREIDDDVREARTELRGVLEAIHVEGEPAERVISVLHFLQRRGGDLFPALGEAFDPFDARERVVVLEPEPERERTAGSS